MTPQTYFDRVRPSHDANTDSLAGVMMCSAISFGLLYLLSDAIHSCACRGRAAASNIRRLEAEIKKGDTDASSPCTNIQARNDSHSPSQPNIRQRNSSRASVAPIQVVSSVDAACDPASSSLVSAYLEAYAGGIASGDTNGRLQCIEWNSRVVSNVHAVVSCALGVVCFFYGSSRVESGLGVGDVDTSTPFDLTWSFALFSPFSSSFTPSLLAFNSDFFRDAALMVTCGYLAFDLALCLWVRWTFRRQATHLTTATPTNKATATIPAASPSRASIDDGLTLVHHVLIICAFSLGVHLHIGTYFMSCFLLNEASTPMLNFNFFLAVAGEEWRNGRAYKLNGGVLFLVFAVARVAFNLYAVVLMLHTWSSLRVLFSVNEWPFLLHASAPLPPVMLAQCTLLTALAVGHVTINLVWFSHLYRAIRRKLCRQVKRA